MRNLDVQRWKTKRAVVRRATGKAKVCSVKEEEKEEEEKTKK